MMQRIPAVVRRQRDGRSLVTRMVSGQTVPGCPETITNATSTTARLTANATNPAPVAVEMLEHPAHAADYLAQTFQRRAAGLERSLTEYDLEELRRGSPKESLQTSVSHLHDAIKATREASTSLRKARIEIGWHVASPRTKQG